MDNDKDTDTIDHQTDERDNTSCEMVRRGARHLGPISVSDWEIVVIIISFRFSSLPRV